MKLKPTPYVACTGTVDNLTLYERKGEIIGRLHSTGNKHKWQPAQCLVASNTANSIHLYRMFPEEWKPEFQFLLPGQNNYNRFLSFARHTPPIYLVREEVELFAAVVVPVAVSDGVLPPITAWWETDCVVTDLSIGPAGSAEGLTVRGLTEALLSRNGGWEEGDTLLFYHVLQHFSSDNPSWSYPYAQVLAAGLTLSLADDRPLEEVARWAKGFESVEGRLAHTAVADGGVAWVHLRKSEKECLRSPQRLLCRNPLIERYSTFEQAMAVWKSFRVKLEQPFLMPDQDLRTYLRKW